MSFCCVVLLPSLLYFLLFFFKQKTAYDMRIRYWSSVVCSSDLFEPHRRVDEAGCAVAVRHLDREALQRDRAARVEGFDDDLRERRRVGGRSPGKIGIAAWRERVC